MSKENSSASAVRPGTVMWTLPGSRRVPGGSGSPVAGSRSRGPVRRTPSRASTAAITSSRSPPRRAASAGCSATASATAAASAAARATDTVPERRRRSWPPPCTTASNVTSRRTSRAPTPTGAPTLCPETARVAAPDAAKSTGTAPRAWTASVCNGTPWSAASRAASATGWTVPISLLAHISVARAVRSGAAASAAPHAARSTRPSSSTGTSTGSAPSCAASQSTTSRTAWCSMPVSTIRVRSGAAARRARYSPWTARLSASVPPDVRITSVGCAPSAAAMRSRASSRCSLARRPEAWREAGLPGSAAASARAASAVGRTVVVAAWSRCTRSGVVTRPV